MVNCLCLVLWSSFKDVNRRKYKRRSYYKWLSLSLTRVKSQNKW